jgi:energy-coupling factor transport system permease protein
MNPRAVALWSASALTIVLIGNNPVYRALVGLAAIAFLAAASSSRLSAKPLLALAAAAIPITVALNLAFGHAGDHVFARLPSAIPAIGGAITLESLTFGLASGIGVMAAVLAAAPLSRVLEPHELLAIVPAALSRTGVTLAAALNLVPGLGRSFRGVYEAQALRGKPQGRFRAAGEVLVPAMLTAIEGSIQMAESMEARGFGGGRRTSFQATRWSARDVFVGATALAAASIFVAARLRGVSLDWFPFPTLQAPGVEAGLAAACGLLAAPSITWR